MFGLTTNKALARAAAEAAAAQRQSDADTIAGAGILVAAAVVPLGSYLATQRIRKAAKKAAAVRVEEEATHAQSVHSAAVEAAEVKALRRLAKAKTPADIARASAKNAELAKEAADLMSAARKAQQEAGQAFGAAANMAADLDNPQVRA